MDTTSYVPQAAIQQRLAPGNAAFVGQVDEHRVLPRFYVDETPRKGDVDGEVIIVKKEMVEIRQAGERDNIFLEVTDEHRRRWPNQYAAFRNGQNQSIAGTPLERLFPTMPKVIAELARFNIHSVEALAQTDDSAPVPFLTEWKKRAKVLLGVLEKGRVSEEFEAKLEAERVKNRALEERLEKMEEYISSQAAQKGNRNASARG